MPFLQLKNIESYYGPIMAIKGISLKVEEKQIVTILGANGAGKTTILKTISGVIVPEKGTIEFMGQMIDRMAPHKIVGIGISHVPEGRELFPDLTVRENLMMGAYLRRDQHRVQEDLQKVYTYFDVLRMRPLQMAGNLSGGEQQMLSIARGIMARPRLMLLDEPSLGLAPLLVNEIFHIVRRINQEDKTTILLVEQNALMALSLAQYGYVLESGRIVMGDWCQNLVENEDIKEFYLGIKEHGIRHERRWRRKKKWR
jgi:branched-chain amino acid transport system ATP-binding protein